MDIFASVFFISLIIIPVLLIKQDCWVECDSISSKYIGTTLFSLFTSLLLAVYSHMLVHLTSLTLLFTFILGIVPLIIFVCEYLKKRKVK